MSLGVSMQDFLILHDFKRTGTSGSKSDKCMKSRPLFILQWGNLHNGAAKKQKLKNRTKSAGRSYIRICYKNRATFGL